MGTGTNGGRTGTDGNDGRRTDGNGRANSAPTVINYQIHNSP
ncbi:hypothetical protein [Parabacteroides johnsonii]